MVEVIAKENQLSQHAQSVLEALLDVLIPPDAALGMPGIREFDFVGYVNEVAPDSFTGISEETSVLDEMATRRYGVSLTELSANERRVFFEEITAQDRSVAYRVIALVAACYYQDERVLRALGMPSGPPFPKGHVVARGDLSLLVPVRRRGKMYREC